MLPEPETENQYEESQSQKGELWHQSPSRVVQSPGVHVIIDERIDHSIAHRQPVERQVDVPYVLV